MTELSDNEYQVLSIIGESSEPLGSGAISQKMKMLDNDISEATTGRCLRNLDHKGLTEKIGFQGRLLTAAGRQALNEHQKAKELQVETHRFIRLARAGAKKELLHILVARRAIEKETCRLAAENATDEDIRILKAITDQHQEHVNNGMSGAEEDTAFHQAIARIGSNKFLAAALDLIRKDAQLSPVLEYIRERVGSTIVTDHKKILTAIEKHDADEAERNMTLHIENIIDDVKKYWDIANRA